MVGAVIVLIAGILFFDCFDTPPTVVWGGFILCCTMAAAIRRHSAGAVYTLFAIFFFGGGVHSLRHSVCCVPCNRTVFVELAVEEHPAYREHYVSAPARLLRYEDIGSDGRPAANIGFDNRKTACRRDRNNIHDCKIADCRVVLLADTSLHLSVGDRIRCIGRVRPFLADRGSYQALMLRRGFAGTVFISPADTVGISHSGRRSLHSIAVERFARLRLPADVAGVVGAAGIGDRSGLTPDLRRAYSRSGASHVLAVSGLHVGIVFMVMNFLLGWLPALRYGHIIRSAAVIVPVWLYASAVGMSPGVIRAAATFSILQIAVASSSVRIGLNVLAAAAFLMLVFDPDSLFDISFQLSFIAVAAILSVARPLFRVVRSRNIFLRAVWDTAVVSIVASVATAPLVSHTFGIIPLAGILISPLVILCAYIIVAVSVVWIVAPLPFLAPVAETLLRSAAELQNTVVAAIASQRWAAVDCTLSCGGTVAIYLLFVAIISLCACIERKKSVHLPE